MIQADDKRQVILASSGHILVTGGPGSGKTTVALLKTEHFVQSGNLKPGQKVLFLSFARATIARVVEAAKSHLSKETLSRLEVETYHGFAWRLITNHGYLVNPRKAKLFPPSDIASRFADIPLNDQNAELNRLWKDEGLLGFDLFPGVAFEILDRCNKLSETYSDKYPLIIIDEFQDTSSTQWEIIKKLLATSTVIALADPDQRIYEFAGADPKRIGEFIEHVDPIIVDLANDNHRSGGADIATFGNDLLTGKNIGRVYNNVSIRRYSAGKARASPEFALKTEIYSSMKRLIPRGKNWSIAVLVTSQNLMISMAKYFSSDADGLRPLNHHVHVDQEGPCLAAAIIAGLLEGGTPTQINDRLLSHLLAHVRGRKGQGKPPSQSDLGFSVTITNEVERSKIKRKDQRQTVDACATIANSRSEFVLTGKPEDDWVAMVELMRTHGDARILKVVDDARFIRLLRRGTSLRERLNYLWRTSGSYVGAQVEVETALTQLHLSQNNDQPTGVHLMTIHKSKGKEFDEVILFEGPYDGSRYIYYKGDPTTNLARAQLLLRVGATRAKSKTTICTPSYRGCPLL